MPKDETEFKSSNGINWKAPRSLVRTLEASDSVAKSKRNNNRRRKKK